MNHIASLLALSIRSAFFFLFTSQLNESERLCARIYFVISNVISWYKHCESRELSWAELSWAQLNLTESNLSYVYCVCDMHVYLYIYMWYLWDECIFSLRHRERVHSQWYVWRKLSLVKPVWYPRFAVVHAVLCYAMLCYVVLNCDVLCVCIYIHFCYLYFFSSSACCCDQFLGLPLLLLIQSILRNNRIKSHFYLFMPCIHIIMYLCVYWS